MQKYRDRKQRERAGKHTNVQAKDRQRKRKPVHDASTFSILTTVAFKSSQSFGKATIKAVQTLSKRPKKKTAVITHLVSSLPLNIKKDVYESAR